MEIIIDHIKIKNLFKEFNIINKKKFKENLLPISQKKKFIFLKLNKQLFLNKILKISKTGEDILSVKIYFQNAKKNNIIFQNLFSLEQ